VKLLNRHRIWQAVGDAALIALAWYLAFALRFDYDIPNRYMDLVAKTLPLVIVIKLAVFAGFGFYNHWWRYVSIGDMWTAVRGVVVGALVAFSALYVIKPLENVAVPRSIFFIDLLLLLAFVTGVRLLARTLMERPGRRRLVTRGKEVLVVGAGDAGQLIVKEMLKNAALGYTPLGFVDDDPRKKNLRLHGVRVLGPTSELAHLLRDNRPDEVIIAIPSAAGETRQTIVNVCRDVGVAVKTLPAVHELISGDPHLARRLREVEVEDVLGREAIELDLASIASYLTGETVLVTGAGGSIGSELCRQIAAVGAERLILVDDAENALVAIQRELEFERGYTATVAALADVKDRATVRRLFERFQPGVVFHAAAYKHVPLMEQNPLESVRNNILGTAVVADVASELDVKRFVLVSTDKAVKPKNVLGQTKAVCEWIIEAAAAREQNGTRFISVRFGNVLGSSGSVIPLFRRQIAAGGPVTVTHPDMTRYFMTIPEAVQLIIQAGAIGESGEIYVLDMGTPVRILELAHNMIRLSGKEPERDVAVEFIGVRAGEKLHEELWDEAEHAEPTPHPKILRCATQPVDPAWLEAELAELERLVEAGETLDVVSRLGAMTGSPRRVGTREPAPAETVSTKPG
jgi:FlaA1/EpsC-like NDP-sugar epimerase